VSFSESLPIRFRFGAFELDPSAGELRKSGVKIKLQGQPIEILALLLARPGTVVTRQELQRKLWPDNTFVGFENSLNAAVRRLRTALDDSVEKPRFVETLARRGYRFIAAVHPAEPAQAKSVVQSLAGLPLANLSTSPTAERTSFALRPHPSFAGRASEWSELCGALAEAASGRGRLCLISGEPGIGKTRLCTELAAEAQARGVAVLIGRCAEQEAVTYLPFVEILESLVASAASPELLRTIVGDEGPELALLLPKLRRILTDLPPPLELSPLQARRNLFNAVVDFIVRATGRWATLLILEDLHWADESTLSLLEHLLRRLIELPVLVLGTYRDAESDVTGTLLKTVEESIRSRDNTSIRLLGLPREEVALLLRALSGKDPPPSLVNEIYAETSGNPFFVEELLRYLREEKRLFDSHENFRTDLKIGELEVPRNLRVVVGRRLGRLGAMTREILEAAATIGRSFPFDLLEAATAAAPDPLLDCLDEAEHTALIASSESEARFEFSHELVRQVVLSSLSGARRERLHLDIANAIERLYPDSLEDHYSELAHHFAHSANREKTFEYARLAGKTALARYAYQEAIAHLRAALESVGQLKSERPHDELEIQLILGEVLGAIKGRGAPEAGTAFGRARELCTLTNAPATKMFEALEGAARNLFEQGRRPFALNAAEEMLAIAERSGDLALKGRALLRVGYTLMDGEPAKARPYLERALSSEASLPRSLSAVTLTHVAICLQRLGYIDQALRAMRQAEQAFAHDGIKPWRVAMGHGNAAAFYAELGDGAACLGHADSCESLTDRYSLAEIASGARSSRARALALIGRREEALSLVRACAGNHTSKLSLVQRIRDLFELGDACVEAELVEDGLGIVESLESIAVVRGGTETRDSRLADWLKGRLLPRCNPPDLGTAENCLRRAIERLRATGDRFMELRCATDLARVLRDGGRRDEGRALLAGIYNWFTEGLDTRHLKDAKSLLDELGE
jgi:DNA-binding winged helix-turn-helix (wHTH) protein/tetratricopeptide (TPR) repeat protein